MEDTELIDQMFLKRITSREQLVVGRKETKSKKVIINFFYDAEHTSFSNISELFAVLSRIFKDWGGTIVSDEVNLSGFYVGRHGYHGVKHYFTSRNLEMPPFYDHYYYCDKKVYNIFQIKLKLSFKTWDDLFINWYDSTSKNQDEFKVFLTEKMKLPYTIEKKKRYSGFNIDIQFGTSS